MDKLIICETDRGRYVVRPMSWAGIWNEKGQIKESLNHLALFIEKEDAEKFVEWKEAEEQNRLLKLPCAVGDTVYVLRLDNTAYMMNNEKVWEIVEDKFEIFHFDSIGKTVFFTREEAEATLKELERGKGE